MKKAKKLTLGRETLLRLGASDMERMHGGLRRVPDPTGGEEGCNITEPITGCHVTCPLKPAIAYNPNS